MDPKDLREFLRGNLPTAIVVGISVALVVAPATWFVASAVSQQSMAYLDKKVADLEKRASSLEKELQDGKSEAASLRLILDRKDQFISTVTPSIDVKGLFSSSDSVKVGRKL